jgi:hypothetical protein
MKFPCQITATRKNRPLYFTSDEQFQWMIAILQHFIPDINLELDGLKTIGTQLGIPGPAPPGYSQTPMRSLPASLEGIFQRGTSMSNQSEAMSERSQSPNSAMGKEDEVDAAEGLMDMTDTGVAESETAPESQETTPQGFRISFSMELTTRGVGFPDRTYICPVTAFSRMSKEAPSSASSGGYLH